MDELEGLIYHTFGTQHKHPPSINLMEPNPNRAPHPRFSNRRLCSSHTAFAFGKNELIDAAAYPQKHPYFHPAYPHFMMMISLSLSLSLSLSTSRKKCHLQERN
jgi:hypothetical protein